VSFNMAISLWLQNGFYRGSWTACRTGATGPPQGGSP
jgi:hypothetical protein